MAENEKELSFEELLNQSEASSLKQVNAGQKVSGKVIMVSKEGAFIDIGMRTEAFLPIPAGETSPVNEGDDVEVYVTKPSGQVELSLEPVMGFGDFSIVAEAHENGEPIEGKVAKIIPGGYEINIAGVRCFCPHSQINIRAVKSPEEMVGQTLPFKVLELDPNTSNVVLSRRALLEEALNAKLEETRKKLVVGETITGTVADIQNFGAFIDLGGIQGLVHVSQLAYQQVARVEDVLSVGDEVEVKILDITRDQKGKERISLSRKALLPNPWDNLPFEEGQEIEARVVRKSNYGIFMNVAPSVDGLLPRRLLKKAGKQVEMDEFTEGESCTVEVIEIDRRGRKVALALPGWNEEIKSNLKVGDALTVEVLKVLPVGVLVQGVEDPAKGLIHKRTLKQGSMKNIADTYQPGTKLEVILEDLDSQGRYNFVLKGDSDLVDRDTISKFSDNQEDLGHNPFASFFKDK